LIGSFSGAPVEIGTGVAVVAERAFFSWTVFGGMKACIFVCADFGQPSVPGKLAEWGVVLQS
jgi:glycine cleavage system pyridoxal-binding protein P